MELQGPMNLRLAHTPNPDGPEDSARPGTGVCNCCGKSPAQGHYRTDLELPAHATSFKRTTRQPTSNKTVRCPFFGRSPSCARPGTPAPKTGAVSGCALQAPAPAPLPQCQVEKPRRSPKSMSTAASPRTCITTSNGGCEPEIFGHDLQNAYCQWAVPRALWLRAV